MVIVWQRCACWLACVCPFHPDLGLSGTMRAPHIIFFQTFSLFAYLSGDRDRADPCNLYEGRPLSPLDVGPSSNCSACHIHSLSFLFAVSSDGDGRRISDLLTVDSELLSRSLSLSARCYFSLLLVMGKLLYGTSVRPESRMAMPMPPANGGKNWIASLSSSSCDTLIRSDGASFCRAWSAELCVLIQTLPLPCSEEQRAF